MSPKTADLVTFTEKNLNENLHILLSVNVSDHSRVFSVRLDTEKRPLMTMYRKQEFYIENFYLKNS